ncbi:MAG: LptF/LptG family permease [Alphaproteobacteria bacterium]
MNIFSRYILTMFTRTALTMLAALTAVFLVFDILSNAGDITTNSNNALKTLLDYISLRLPGTFILIMPIAALLSAMITMHKMARSREMIAAFSAGFTIYRVALILSAGALFLSLVQFVLAETALSATSTRLRLWAAQDYAKTPPKAPETNKTTWAAAGDYILHYETASPDGHTLTNPLLIHRTKTGLIDDYTRARRAFYDGEAWQLLDSAGKSVKINIPLHPDDFSIPAQTYEEIRLTQLWPLVFSSGQTTPLHTLWLQRKFAQPLSIIVMALLAAPLGLFMARQYNPLLTHFSFLMAGFSFFIMEKLLLSMGESAALPAFLAVWSPLLIFTAMSLWFMLYKQE